MFHLRPAISSHCSPFATATPWAAVIASYRRLFDDASYLPEDFRRGAKFHDSPAQKPVPRFTAIDSRSAII